MTSLRRRKTDANWSGTVCRLRFFGQSDLKGKKNKRACISTSGENHEKWRIGGWTLYLACIFVYNYAYLINKRG